ncbi:YLP motif-containing protein 1-like isoform X1 [Spodoptera litura]|uniref:YLP motif-containing protein 1 n=1 Tax=Spodoptera litura TaxID=69820 RepID=A0A9J7EDQ4_SPOLT|nr:YLP motif-containing protein 1-like isoform X1 [Spodoptera litura]
MAWPMPTAGQWGSGIAMTPEINMANMGSYTAEQWAVMQQQNWQQWTQWQQQYAQWHGQYGDKYVEQMQALQAMGGMPPLPTTNVAPPPAPPPPDQPPPPPHENNQPLFGNTSKPTPVPAPGANQQRNNNSGNNVNINVHNQAGSNANWTQGTESAQAGQTTVNADALKKLAEEERLFDIQFQKWEEEIEKWKKDNVNHPDKQAYKEYEQKFESCRAQLMERRLQMKQKRARLMGTNPPTQPEPPTPSTTAAKVVTPTVNASLNTTNINAFPSKQTQNYGNNLQNYANNNIQSYSTNNSSHNYSNNSQNYNNNQQNYNNNQQNYGNNQQHYGSHQQSYGSQQMNYPNTPQNYGNNSHKYGKNAQNYGNNLQNYNNSSQNYTDKSAHYQDDQYKGPNTNNNMGNSNKNVDPQDRFESYQTMGETDYQGNTNFSTPTPTSSSSFLPTSGDNKGIPGLDLVPETDKPHVRNTNDEVIDISNDKSNPGSDSKAPDYTTISKGINNILGDEKIMNILSMVRGQTAQSPATTGPPNVNPPSGQYNSNVQNNAPYGHGNRNLSNQNYNNQQFDDNRQNMSYNRPGQNYLGHHQDHSNFPPPNRMHEEIPQDQYDYDNDRNIQYSGNDIRPPYQNNAPLRGHAPIRPNMSAPRPPLRPLMSNLSDHPMGNQGLPERKPLLEHPVPKPPVRPQWLDEPMFTPSLIVEYEHKPLRLKARDFIEPVHTFHYNHKSKDGEVRKKDFEKEVDELFQKKPTRSDAENDYGKERYSRDHYSRDFERRAPRYDVDLLDEIRPRGPPRSEYDDRRRDRYDDRRRDDREDDRRRDDREDDRRRDDREDDRRRDDRDKYLRREDSFRDRDREYRDRDLGRESRREEGRYRSRSRDRDSRKRGLSKESDSGKHYSKKPRDKDESLSGASSSKHIVMIDDLLESPGRSMRPDKIVVILRGPPGSGKSYLAKLIRDREAEYGGTVRIMSIDDYFMQEGEVEEKDPSSGKIIKKPTLKYEYDASYEESYLTSLKRAFKRTLTDGFFTFLIYDAVNEQLRCYADIWNFARQNGFQVYICTMELDAQVCYKRNIHNRTLQEIEAISSRFFPTPLHHIQLDPTTLLQSAAITEVQMEDADDDVQIVLEDSQETEVESVFTSKWEKMDDAAQLARLDGTSKPLRPSQLSMEDYLQLDEWTPNKAQPGKKSVRWADIEERRQQEKMRAIGFVVGQTDWNRMTDPTMGSSALTQTKYIERVRRN